MSQENVEMVQRWVKRWNAGDRDFSTDELHPDFQVVCRPEAEPFAGREGLHRWMQEVEEQFGSGSLSRTSGARRATVLLSSVGSDFVGQGAVSRGINRMDGWHSYRTAWRPVPTLRPTADALEAAGLSE